MILWLIALFEVQLALFDALVWRLSYKEEPLT